MEKIYQPKSGGLLDDRCKKLGIVCFEVKRPLTAEELERDKALRSFVQLADEKTLYEFEYHGKRYVGGDLPRDLGNVIRGIEIATQKA